MSVTVSKDSVTSLKERVQGYTMDKSLKGIILTVVVAVCVLVVAFFMNMIKWVLVLVAVLLLLSVGYRVFLKWKASKNNMKV
jgi:small-conductance mechanosensitive channel